MIVLLYILLVTYYTTSLLEMQMFFLPDSVWTFGIVRFSPFPRVFLEWFTLQKLKYEDNGNKPCIHLKIVTTAFISLRCSNDIQVLWTPKMILLARSWRFCILCQTWRSSPKNTSLQYINIGSIIAQYIVSATCGEILSRIVVLIS